MTWQERRTITILSTILAVLCAALLIVLGMRYRENRDQPETPDGTVPGITAGDAASITALTYENGKTTLSFSLDEAGKWTWDGDPEFPLDTATVDAILELLVSWTPQQTVTDSDAIANSGMDAPTASLTASTESGSAITMTLGRATTDGNSYYMQLNDQEDTVYIIPDTLYRLMCVPIYDMYILPELPELTENTIASIVIRGAAAGEDSLPVITSLSAQRTEEGGAATWRCDGANVTDDETVQALLDDLSGMAFEKCVDYRPSDEAAEICGFTSPAATVDIRYLTEGGTEQTLLLTIGTQAADGTGRYVRMDEDSTIYLLPTASLDPLMRISAKGLEG
ncbi:DUF4340 domain-containing protein [uncultured Dysosmobacter sp.]|uniref:DUF4340 domain-containing protein n=1 Tax=uncultured Dysosmobacter sp. TaxID=2591384 RepID=UPI0026185182|nr:DUF4340 domain-containing protein [uncultured Dysosmobacter sp.]